MTVVLQQTLALLVGLPGGHLQGSCDGIAGHVEVLGVSSAGDAVRILWSARVSVLLIGPQRSHAEAELLIEHSLGEASSSSATIVMSCRVNSHLIQCLIRPGRLFYSSLKVLPRHELIALLRAAVRGRGRIPRNLRPSNLVARCPQMQRSLTLEFCRSMAMERETRSLCKLGGLQRILGVERAYHVYRDGDAETLDETRVEVNRHGASTSGVTSFVLKTGLAVHVECLRQDPQYHAQVDDPCGDGNERLIEEPIRARNGQLREVLVATRSRRRPPFSDNDVAVVRLAA